MSLDNKSENYKNVIVTVVTSGVWISNIIALLGTFLCKEVRSHKVAPLAISVFVAGLLGVATGLISAYLSWRGLTEPGQFLGKIHCFLGIFPPTITLASAAGLALAKAITIVKPLQENSLITCKRVNISSALIWILGALFSVPYAFFFGYEYQLEPRITLTSPEGLHYYKFPSIAVYLTLVSILTGANSIIIVIVVQQIIKIRRARVHAEDAPIQPNPVLQVYKSARGLLAVCIIYNTFYLPVLIIGTTFWTCWFGYSSSIFHSIAYIVFSPKIKTALKNVLSLLCCGSNVVEAYPGSEPPVAETGQT